MVEDEHSATSSYQRSDLDLPGPKYDSSLTSKFLKGPTFKALASGGVHRGGTCSSGRRDALICSQISASCQ